jgi:hypothetical protein
MATKVIFVNQFNEEQTFKVNLFGPNKKHVKINNVLIIFKAFGNMMEVNDLKLSMGPIEVRSNYIGHHKNSSFGSKFGFKDLYKFIIFIFGSKVCFGI